MQVIKLLPQGFAANTYFVTEDGKNAVAVDPAQPRALQEAQKRGLSVKYVLLTHGHFDHIGGVSALQKAGAEVGICSGEEELALLHNLGEQFGQGPVPPFGIDFTVSDGEELELCGLKIRVICTPGHTSHSACYLVSPLSRPAASPDMPVSPDDRCGENGGSGSAVLFTGDTLFRGSVGRTDLPTGSAAALERSLSKLKRLGNCTLFPGHGENSDLSYEKTHNGYLR